MRTYFAILEPDGSLAAREVHRRGVPWDALPPTESAYTADEDMADIVNQAVAPAQPS